MFPKWKGFRRNEQGQDLAEYCLITAAIALVGLGLFISMSGGLQGLWGAANSAIAAGGSAITTAGSSTGDSSGGGDHGGDHGNHGDDHH